MYRDQFAGGQFERWIKHRHPKRRARLALRWGRHCRNGFRHLRGHWHSRQPRRIGVISNWNGFNRSWAPRCPDGLNRTGGGRSKPDAPSTHPKPHGALSGAHPHSLAANPNFRGAVRDGASRHFPNPNFRGAVRDGANRHFPTHKSRDAVAMTNGSSRNAPCKHLRCEGPVSPLPF